MKDFWEKLDGAFAYIFNNKKEKKEEKNENTGNERRLPRSNAGTGK